MNRNIQRNQITLMPTGACNMNCPYCTQQAVKDNYGDYFMTFPEFEYFLDRIEELDLHYKEFIITGGEPTLWPELENACALAKKRGLFGMIRLNTNCIKRGLIASLIKKGLVDEVYTSYSNGHRRHQKELRGWFGSHVRITQTKIKHKIPPIVPYSNVLPAFNCGCARPTVLKDRIYICGNIYSIVHRIGKKIEDYPEISASIEENWEAKFREVDKFNMIFCAYCTANLNVWNKIPDPKESK